MLQRKRVLLSLWLLIVAAQAGIAALPWNWVLYTVGQTEKQSTLSGFDSHAILGGQILFGLAGWAAISVARAVARRILAWVLGIASAFMLYQNIQLFLNALSDTVPAKVNALVEKASGIAGGGPGGSSAAITDHSNSETFALLFVLATLVLMLVQIMVALKSKTWDATDKRDKYQRTVKKTEAKSTKKGDNIELWDSQR